MRIQFPALFQSQTSQTRCAILGECIHFTRMPRALQAFPQSWGLAGFANLLLYVALLQEVP